MKKKLLVLTLAAIMCVLMAVSVSAVISQDDVGLYIRFSDQETIDKHVTNYNSWLNVAYDAERGAMRYTPLRSTVGGTDQRLNVDFGEGVDTSEYPYMRITYMIPTTDIKGDATATLGNAIYVYPNNGSIGWAWANSNFRFTDSWVNNGLCSRSIIEINPGTMTSFRMDAPNFTTENNWEVIIYDVGLFKTPEAAASYNPAQDHYFLDMTIKDNGVGWSIFGGDSKAKMYYNDVDGLWIYDYYTGDAPARARSTKIPATEWFSPSEYPFFSSYNLSTVPTLQTYIFNQGISPYNAEGTYNTISGTSSFLQDMIGVSGCNGVLKGSDERVGGWGVTYMDLTNAYVTNSNQHGTQKMAAVVEHHADWINVDSRTEDKPYRIGFEYIAYYPTEEMAKLRGQAAPTTVKGVAPTTAGGKGTLTGLTTDMEYRETGKGEYVAVTATTLEVDAAKTYDVRYKAKEGYNAGYAAQVGVPHYWKFNLTGIAGVDGEAIEQVDAHNWTVTVPFGTDLANIVPEFTAETGAPGDRGAVQVRSNPQYITNNIGVQGNPQNYVAAVLTSGETAVDASKGEVLLGVYHYNAVFEYVNITVEVDGGVDGEALGAQYRPETDSANGEAIRFGTKINLTGWQNKVTDISYGTLVTSKEALGDNALTHAFTVDVVDVPATKIFETGDNYIIYTAAVYNIPADDETTDLVAVGYAKYTIGETTYYHYFDEVTRSLNGVKAASGWLK